MSFITKQENDAEFKQGISEMTRTDVCISHNARLNGYMLLDANEMKAQMTMWKKQGKALTIFEANNRTRTFNGKTFYTMTLLPTKMVESGHGDGRCCLLSMALGTMVNGHTYAFVMKENRDAVFKYLSKHLTIRETSKEWKEEHSNEIA